MFDEKTLNRVRMVLWNGMGGIKPGTISEVVITYADGDQLGGVVPCDINSGFIVGFRPRDADDPVSRVDLTKIRALRVVFGNGSVERFGSEPVVN